MLSLVVRGDTIFAGCQDGLVKVWDLETRNLVRTLLVVEVGYVLGMSSLAHHSPTVPCNLECGYSVYVYVEFGSLCLFRER